MRLHLAAPEHAGASGAVQAGAVQAHAVQAHAVQAGGTAALTAKLVRCLSVSMLTTTLSLTTLATLTAGFGVRAWLANVVATALGTAPSYLLMRRWVWGRSGAHDLRREVLPFWGLSFSGLVASTVAVDAADRLARSLALGGALGTLAVLAANVGAFALLWVAQYLLLDRVLFAEGGRSRRDATQQNGDATMARSAKLHGSTGSDAARRGSAVRR